MGNQMGNQKGQSDGTQMGNATRWAMRSHSDVHPIGNQTALGRQATCTMPLSEAWVSS